MTLSDIHRAANTAMLLFGETIKVDLSENLQFIVPEEQERLVDQNTIEYMRSKGWRHFIVTPPRSRAFCVFELEDKSENLRTEPTLEVTQG